MTSYFRRADTWVVHVALDGRTLCNKTHAAHGLKLTDPGSDLCHNCAKILKKMAKEQSK